MSKMMKQWAGKEEGRHAANIHKAGTVFTNYLTIHFLIKALHGVRVCHIREISVRGVWGVRGAFILCYVAYGLGQKSLIATHLWYI